jgi:hypothetical protein
MGPPGGHTVTGNVAIPDSLPAPDVTHTAVLPRRPPVAAPPPPGHPSIPLAMAPAAPFAMACP